MDQDNIDKLNNLNDVFTAMDLAEGVIKDKVLGQKLGTTSTGKFGVLAAGFGVSEQLEIWNKSEKSFEDFERLSIGLGTNIPSPLSLMLVPKKAFDDNFDQGTKEAENLRGLLVWSSRLDGVLRFGDKLNIKPIEDNVKTVDILTEPIASSGTIVEASKSLSESQVIANVKAKRSPDGKEAMGEWIQDAPNQGHSWYQTKDGSIQRIALTTFDGGNNLIVTEYAKGSMTPKQEQHTIRGADGAVLADIMVKPDARGKMEGRLIDAASKHSVEKDKLPKQYSSQLEVLDSNANNGTQFASHGQLAASNAAAMKISQDIPENHRDYLQKIVDAMIVKHNISVDLNQTLASVSLA